MGKFQRLSAFGLASNGTILPTASLPHSAVPETATWAMMIAGFGLVGGTLRRHTHMRVAVA